MLTILELKDGGACFADVPLDTDNGAGYVVGPIMSSVEEANEYLEWLRRQGLRPGDLSIHGLSFQLTRYREQQPVATAG